ncbi:uncharacterized protein B0P05DRAFT_194842 [Gilbertella persicaria]|uniref:uncharacterized protein n=1 Tax=Gilbertella persicaria TaxID=101096 RepID=UPI00221E3FC3|nr:uncharacterized protein B0P05DRAFT_194842 [Gilbertella persicaria]KAI8069088.1 hypothetical protein B0P05DRAFT_194842 [Gilbertella persicaria]
MASTIKWAYANGSNWVILDNQAQDNIERLWASNSSNWINSQMFRKPVYVDIPHMMLLCDGVSYSIARYRA